MRERMVTCKGCGQSYDLEGIPHNCPGPFPASARATEPIDHLTVRVRRAKNGFIASFMDLGPGYMGEEYTAGTKDELRAVLLTQAKDRIDRMVESLGADPEQG